MKGTLADVLREIMRPLRSRERGINEMRGSLVPGHRSVLAHDTTLFRFGLGYSLSSLQDLSSAGARIWECWETFLRLWHAS